MRRPMGPGTMALLGVGAVGLIVGGVAGGLAIVDKRTIDAHCAGTVCDRDGKSAADGAKTMGWVSTAGFAVGAAAVGAGAILWLAGTRHPDIVRAVTGPIVWTATGSGLTGTF